MGRLEINKHNEAEIDRRIEADLAGHRQPPNGRNAFAFVMRHLQNKPYRQKFDDTFKGSPSSKEWWANRFCPVCERVRVQCVCGTGKEFEVQEQRFMAPRGARIK